MKILVTGGAGYIGSFMVKSLLNDGYEVIITDSLEKGYRANIASGVTFFEGNLLDKVFLRQLFSENYFDAVIHFAGYISMAESMQDPFKYFEDNTFATLFLLEALQKANIHNVIFSSTAGVYGNPEIIPIPETHKTEPTNPYGESKLMVEKILAWYHSIHGIQYACLRYFNACGAALDGSRGELHEPETHILPLAIKAAQNNTPFTLYGTDYSTSDGTCVRDYIHVLDLVDAHILALEKLIKEKGANTYNVGTGKGYSNKEIIQAVERISGKKLQIINAQKRPGDAARLIADPTHIQKDLGFSPKHSDIDTIVSSAWKWHTKQQETLSKDS